MSVDGKNSDRREPKQDHDGGALLGRAAQLDAEDPLAYYYLPQYPRVARNEDGQFQFLLLKQVGGDAPGGIFHALIEFTLDEAIVERVQAKLEELRPGATLVGALPLLQPGAESAEAVTQRLARWAREDNGAGLKQVRAEQLHREVHAVAEATVAA